MDLIVELRKCDELENIYVYPVHNGQDQEMEAFTQHILETKV